MFAIGVTIILALSCVTWLIVLMSAYSTYTSRVHLNKQLRMLLLEEDMRLCELEQAYIRRMEAVGSSPVRQTRL